jgi:hypothetical protein
MMAADRAHFVEMRKQGIDKKWARVVREKYYWAGSYATKSSGEEALRTARNLGFDAKLFVEKTYFWLGISMGDPIYG